MKETLGARQVPVDVSVARRDQRDWTREGEGTEAVLFPPERLRRRRSGGDAAVLDGCVERVRVGIVVGEREARLGRDHVVADVALAGRRADVNRLAVRRGSAVRVPDRLFGRAGPPRCCAEDDGGRPEPRRRPDVPGGRVDVRRLLAEHGRHVGQRAERDLVPTGRHHGRADDRSCRVEPEEGLSRRARSPWSACRPDWPGRSCRSLWPGIAPRPLRSGRAGSTVPGAAAARRDCGQSHRDDEPTPPHVETSGVSYGNGRPIRPRAAELDFPRDRAMWYGAAPRPTKVPVQRSGTFTWLGSSTG